jgi:hypothetical protein
LPQNNIFPFGKGTAASITLLGDGLNESTVCEYVNAPGKIAIAPARKTQDRTFGLIKLKQN